MPIADTFIDQVFDGRYRVVRKLGTGGMASVYLAEDQELGRQVAIKVLDERHAQDEQFVERFRREAKNAAGLSHPNIVSIYDRGETDGTYYIAMEFLDGQTLKELIVTRGPTPIPVAVDYTRQILSALSFAHRNGLVHRDIKPHNVIVAPDGRVKVTDFGIARSGSSQMTEAGSIIGTAQYLSPEQARGAPVSPASDLYSVGIVLHEMLTGSVPFTGDTPLEIAMKHLSSVPEPPSANRPGVPRDLDLVVLRALAKRPEARYASAEDMDADLARVAKGLSVSTETEIAATAVLAGAGLEATLVTQVAPARAQPGAPPPYAPPAPYYDYEEPIRRRPLWPWALALVLLVAAGFAAFYVYDRIQNELAQTKPVSVPFVEGIKEELAVQKILAAGLRERVRRVPNGKVAVGRVFDQEPDGGEKLDKGNTVTILVSSGKAKTTVPDVRGRSLADAVAGLTAAKLKTRVVEIHSDRPAGTVTAQDPPPGARVVEGETVRINISKGLKPIAVPSVLGQPFEQAESELATAGFNVDRRDAESDEPEGTVVDMEPAANTLQSRGSTVTLVVSTGPATSAVPDVTGLDGPTAVATIRSSGFRVAVRKIETTDENLGGQVLSQSPEGGAQAKPGATITITVGRFVPPPEPTVTVPTEPTPTEPTPTEPIPTATVPTEPIPTEPEPLPTEPPPPPPTPP